MIQSGDVLHNPVTGETVHFLRTAAETDGELVEIEVTVQPDGAVAAAHVHPYQSERFDVLEGTLEFRKGRETIVAGAGEVVTVGAGSIHHFSNAGDTPARFRTIVRPALQFERFLETMFALAADGKTNRKGMPNPLRLAVIANAHFDDVRTAVLAGLDAARRADARRSGRATARLRRRVRRHDPARGSPGAVTRRLRVRRRAPEAQPSACTIDSVDAPTTRQARIDHRRLNQQVRGISRRLCRRRGGLADLEAVRRENWLLLPSRRQRDRGPSASHRVREVECLHHDPVGRSELLVRTRFSDHDSADLALRWAKENHCVFDGFEARGVLVRQTRCLERLLWVTSMGPSHQARSVFPRSRAIARAVAKIDVMTASGETPSARRSGRSGRG